MFTPSLLNSPTSFTPRPELIEVIFRAISEQIDITQSGTVNIAFLLDDEIQSLNNTHRGIDKTTDVLSFHYFEDFTGLKDDEIAGEIIMSEAKILSQAEEYGNTPEAEFAKLLIHSTLHLLGYDHEDDEEYKKMRAEEQKIEKILLEKMGVRIS
ncbi:MAG: rRNA maturation RNase YbeY [Candidatus Gracilibacteria bacterium]|nr:rRNA maturation RNase YbeY [Candidatus Gracilibacteria bacterium]